MSGGVLAHHGAALSGMNTDDLHEFLLMAEIKGEIGPDQDHETIGQLNFRASGTHAFSTDP